MAARDIFTLDEPMAPRLVRLLYLLAMILIALGVVLGVARGVGAASRMPALPPLPVTAQSQTQALDAPPSAMPDRMPQRRMRGPGRMDGPGFNGPRRGFGREFGGMSMRRTPALFGAMLIVRALLMGFIALLVVRILAEMALAVVNLPRRSET